jgi:hypothetical protein
VLVVLAGVLVVVVVVVLVVERWATLLTCCPWFSPAGGVICATAETASPWLSASDVLVTAIVLVDVDVVVLVDVVALWAAALTASPWASPRSSVERATDETVAPWAAAADIADAPLDVVLVVTSLSANSGGTLPIVAPTAPRIAAPTGDDGAAMAGTATKPKSATPTPMPASRLRSNTSPHFSASRCMGLAVREAAKVWSNCCRACC